MIDPRGLEPSVIRGVFAGVPGTKVRYVQSTHTKATNLNTQGLNYNFPLKTVQKAIENSLANDTIIVMPGHVELINAAAALAINKNGLNIVCLGGRTTNPRFIVGALTTANIVLSASDVRMSNFRLECDIDSAVNLMNIAGSGNAISNANVVNTASKQSLIAFSVATAAARNSFDRITSEQDTAGAVSCISLAGACDRTQIVDCILRGNYSDAPLNVLGAATNLFISRNSLHNVNAAFNCIKLAAAASTGNISFNHCRNAQADAAATWITMGAGSLVQLFENYGVNIDTETGKLIGAVSG
jgi:hypothetical protein